MIPIILTRATGNPKEMLPYSLDLFLTIYRTGICSWWEHSNSCVYWGPERIQSMHRDKRDQNKKAGGRGHESGLLHGCCSLLQSLYSPMCTGCSWIMLLDVPERARKGWSWLGDKGTAQWAPLRGLTMGIICSPPPPRNTWDSSGGSSGHAAPNTNLSPEGKTDLFLSNRHHPHDGSMSQCI